MTYSNSFCTVLFSLLWTTTIQLYVQKSFSWNGNFIVLVHFADNELERWLFHQSLTDTFTHVFLCWEAPGLFGFSCSASYWHTPASQISQMNHEVWRWTDGITGSFGVTIRASFSFTHLYVADSCCYTRCYLDPQEHLRVQSFAQDTSAYWLGEDRTDNLPTPEPRPTPVFVYTKPFSQLLKNDWLASFNIDISNTCQNIS